MEGEKRGKKILWVRKGENYHGPGIIASNHVSKVQQRHKLLLSNKILLSSPFFCRIPLLLPSSMQTSHYRPDLLLPWFFFFAVVVGVKLAQGRRYIPRLAEEEEGG